MKVRIGLVEIKDEYRCLLRLFMRLKWVPVYLPSHSDPELGGHAYIEHYHIAWNRISKKDSRGERRAKTPVWKYQVERIRIPKSAPIISPPCVMYRTHFPEIPIIKARIKNGHRDNPKTSPAKR